MAYWRLQIYGFLKALNTEISIKIVFFYPYIIYLYVIFVIAFFIPVLQDLFENLKQNGAVPESDLISLATKYGINYWGLILFYILLVCQFSICNKRIMIHFAFVVLSTFRKRNPPLNIRYSQYFFFFLENPLFFFSLELSLIKSMHKFPLISFFFYLGIMWRKFHFHFSRNTHFKLSSILEQKGGIKKKEWACFTHEGVITILWEFFNQLDWFHWFDWTGLIIPIALVKLVYL